MAASLLFACGLNEQKLPSYVHISEESEVDGSFLISAMLGQRLRISNAGTLLICLQNDYQHYFHAGMRLGYNTNIFLGKTLSVIDAMSEMIREGVQESRWLSVNQSVTAMLMTNIREQLFLSQKFTNRHSITILIDNLSMLLNMGATKLDLLQFAYELADLPQEFENLTVVTKMSNCDIYSVADSNVAKRGDLRIRVKKLQSGLFREVDGKLLIERDAELADEDIEVKRTCKEVLYKVNERNIKIFAPGEVGVKV